VVRSEASRSAILYIEGDPTQVRLVQLMFEERPTLQLLTATDGRAGVALARERRPDLILLDLHLRDMAAEDVLHAIRAEPALAQTAVIVFTDERYSRLPQRLRVAGAQAYLMKPVNLQEFFDVVDAHLRAHPPPAS
jgi:DNA-binding response OmpR family regulator